MNNEPLITPQNTDPREISKLYYFAGFRISEISKIVGTPESTLYDWRKADKWDEADFFTKCQDAFQLKYLRLLMTDSKTDSQMKEFKELGNQMKNIYSPKPQRNKRGAQINSDQFDWEKFKGQIREGFQDLKLYQQSAINAIKKYEKHRLSAAVYNWLKSRQIGFSYGLAFDALLRLVELENNQIYIAASKNQAFTSRNYVFKFVKDLTGVDLSGTDSVEFKKGLRFYFLGANPSTAQSYSGDVTMDEFMWMPRFEELNEVVTGCATNGRYVVKRMSTPSSKKHPAYKMWAAIEWNKIKANKKVHTDYKTLKSGLLCPDGQYRRIITLQDAINEGCDWVSIERQRLRYPDKETFARLYECEFMDDVSSAFDFDHINACMVDSWEEWNDFKPLEKPNNPFGRKKVAVGYDVARTNDGAACVVVALPDSTHKKRRILEKHFWQDTSFDAQENNLRDICKRYNVVHMGVDARNMGLVMAERAQKFCNFVVPYMSDMQLKTLFVMQAKTLFRDRNVAFDSSWQDLVNSFMNVKKAMTKSMQYATYQSIRDEENGHADLSWATMYAFGFEGFDGVIASDTDDLVMEI